MAAPLVMRGELLGVLYLERDSGRRPYGEDDLEILLGLGNQVAIALVTTRSARLELQTALQERRILEQGDLLDAAAKMASGDLDAPIVACEGSDLVKLARALEAMRQDVRAKIMTLEAKNTEIQALNEELRRQIEQRSRRLLETFLGQGARKPEDAKPLSKGSLLGEHYLVVKTLGEGAMGVVYEVERTTDSRRLAAKVMTGEAHKTALVRFAREAQILAKLRHPNLIGIFDVDVTASGILYIVMELVTGTTLLRMRWRFGDLFWALPVLRQMAEALALVHDRGIVHRDLKPANVLVAQGPPDQPPRVKVADFGISVLVEGEDSPLPDEGEIASGDDLSEVSWADADVATVPVLRRAPPAAPRSPSPAARPSAPRAVERRGAGEVTETGILVGTPMYMAPELARGSRFARSPSDIFSLGVIAYELITTEMPFDTPPVLAGVRGDELVAPQGLRAKGELDPALAALFERCLSMDPAARPSAQHIVSVLASFGVSVPEA
jgi:serine/threonine protein kinase